MGLAWLEDEFGISIRDVDSVIAQRLGLPRERGVLVMRVLPDLGAERAGIRPGEMITSINKQDVETVSQFLAELNRTDIAHGLLVGIMDPRGAQRLVVMPP
jgi:S1-C subfamily serine protease